KSERSELGTITYATVTSHPVLCFPLSNFIAIRIPHLHRPKISRANRRLDLGHITRNYNNKIVRSEFACRDSTDILRRYRRESLAIGRVEIHRQPPDDQIRESTGEPLHALHRVRKSRHQVVHGALKLRRCNLLGNDWTVFTD